MTGSESAHSRRLVRRMPIAGNRRAQSDCALQAAAGVDGAAAYDCLVRGFRRALQARRTTLSSSEYVFAGRIARVRIVGASLAARFARPFAHLRCHSSAATAAELYIDLWDESESGVPCAGCIPWQDATQPAIVSASSDGRWVSRRKAQTWTAFDRVDQHVVGWIADCERLSQYELGRPLHPQLLLWHADRGVPAVHAGLVALDGQGVLVAGPGGSGKSTVCVACAQTGFAYLADDYVGLESHGAGCYTGHSFYGSSHLDPAHLNSFPGLGAVAIAGKPPLEDKSLVFLSDVAHVRLERSARIRAILLPHVAGTAGSCVRRAGKIEALLRIAPTSLRMLPSTAFADGFHLVSRLVNAVPAYWLDAGHDLVQIPAVMADFLSQVCGRSDGPGGPPACLGANEGGDDGSACQAP